MYKHNLFSFCRRQINKTTPAKRSQRICVNKVPNYRIHCVFCICFVASSTWMYGGGGHVNLWYSLYIFSPWLKMRGWEHLASIGWHLHPFVLKLADYNSVIERRSELTSHVATIVRECKKHNNVFIIIYSPLRMLHCCVCAVYVFFAMCSILMNDNKRLKKLPQQQTDDK